MSTNPDLLQPHVREPEIFELPPAIGEPEILPRSPQADPRCFAEEQMRALVRQVFCPGWPRPARQVVVSAVDATVDVADVCLQAGQALSEQVDASIGIIQADPHSSAPELSRNMPAFDTGTFGVIRAFSHQVSTNLWHVPFPVFTGEQNTLSAAWLRGRLAELRLEFDYTILQGPPAGQSGEIALLGHLSDGVVLVLEANATRRVTALRVKEKLQMANVRILGAVLSERTFPIPQAIYDCL